MHLPFIGVKEGGAEDVLVSEMRSWQWWLEHWRGTRTRGTVKPRDSFMA